MDDTVRTTDRQAIRANIAYPVGHLLAGELQAAFLHLLGNARSGGGFEGLTRAAFVHGGTAFAACARRDETSMCVRAPPLTYAMNEKKCARQHHGRTTAATRFWCGQVPPLVAVGPPLRMEDVRHDGLQEGVSAHELNPGSGTVPARSAIAQRAMPSCRDWASACGGPASPRDVSTSSSPGGSDFARLTGRGWESRTDYVETNARACGPYDRVSGRPW